MTELPAIDVKKHTVRSLINSHRYNTILRVAAFMPCYDVIRDVICKSLIDYNFM